MESGVLSDCFSDHCIIYCRWKIKIPRLPPKFIKVRQTKAFNCDNFINDLLNINWNRLRLIPYINEAWNYFYDEILKVINIHAPLIVIKVKGHHLPWVNGELLHLYKKRDNAWKKYCLTCDPVDWEVYKRLRNTCTMHTRNAKSNYYKDCLSNNFKNIRHFWKKPNNVLGKSDCVSVNMLINNKYTSDPSIIAKAFSQHFTHSSPGQDA